MIETEYSNLITTIEGLGFRVYDDIMRVRPGGIIIDPPSYRSISPSIVEATYPINFVSLPPGNRKAMNECLAAIDTILESLSEASTCQRIRVPIPSADKNSPHIKSPQ